MIKTLLFLKDRSVYHNADERSSYWKRLAVFALGGTATVLLIGFLSQARVLSRLPALVLSLFAIFFWDDIAMDTSDTDLIPQKLGHAAVFSLMNLLAIGISVLFVFAIFYLMALFTKAIG